MTAHAQFAEDLALYALGTLSQEEKIPLESHLAECAACRRELEELRGGVALLGLSTSGPAPPARARERLLAAIAREPVRERAPRRAQRPLFGWLAIPALAAAVVLAVVG